MIFNNIFIFLIILLALIYWFKYITGNYNYWSKNNIKGPWPIPFLGTFIYYILEYRSKVEVKWIRKYGKIYGIFEGNKPVLRVAVPELIKQILVKDFHIFTNRFRSPNRHPIADKNLVILTGDDWKRVRTIMSPTFTSGKLKKMYPSIRECLKDLMRALEVQSKDGQDFDIKKLYILYTMDVVSTCAFATKTDLYNNPNHLYISNAVNVFPSDHFNVICRMILPTFVMKYFQTLFGSTDIKDHFFDIIRDIMKYRNNSNKTYNDFLELIIHFEKSEDTVRDDNDINESHHVNEGEKELKIKRKTLSGVEKYVTENEIICNAQVFLLMETTATTLSHCTQELALNPEVQEKLYTEIMSSVDSNGKIDYDLLTKLPYLDAVISETLRLHSPSFHLTRMASINYKLGDTGITVMKGHRVEIPIYAIHRCEEYYPNADQFIPERFLPENRHKIIPYTYLPFGGGPRHCIGMRLALLESKLALVHMIQKFKICHSCNTDIPVLKSKSIIFNIPPQIIVTLVKRI